MASELLLPVFLLLFFCRLPEKAESSQDIEPCAGLVLRYRKERSGCPGSYVEGGKGEGNERASARVTRILSLSPLRDIVKLDD